MLDAKEKARLDWILSKAQSASDALNAWEQKFVDDMTEKLERWGERLNVSERQWEILEDIREKAV